jgi:hypothetical protein
MTDAAHTILFFHEFRTATLSPGANQTDTSTYTLSRFLRCKFFNNNIVEYAADSKSADLRGLGGSTPPPGTNLHFQNFSRSASGGFGFVA